MTASHEALVRALVALGFDKGNVSTSLTGLAAKGAFGPDGIAVGLSHRRQ
jgi:hypothetical protein